MTATERRGIWRQNNRERDNANARSWREKNPERYKANQRRSRIKHRIRRLEDTKRWLASLDPDVVREMRRKARVKWQAEHPEKYKAHYLEGYNRERSRAAFLKRKAADPERVRLIGRKGTSHPRARQEAVTVGNLADIAKIYERCAELGQLFKGLVVDHVIPIAKGGTHEAKNLQIIYDFENKRKSARLDYKPRVVFV